MKDTFYQGFESIALAATEFGDEVNTPVIFSHGAGQTRHAWKSAAEKIAEKGWYSIAYDHRGHGDSEWSPDGIYGIDRFASDQIAIAKQQRQKPVLVGASLGGLTSMLVEGELERKQAGSFYKAIVLVDVTPKLRQEGTENILRFMGEQVEEGFASLEEAAKLIADFTGRPLRKDVSGLSKNLKQRDGRYYWHWDPAFLHSLQQRRVSNKERIINAAKRIECPILLVRGQQSELVTQELAEEFLAMVPHAEYVDVAEARHMVAGDKNDIFTDAVSGFLQSL